MGFNIRKDREWNVTDLNRSLTNSWCRKATLPQYSNDYLLEREPNEVNSEIDVYGNQLLLGCYDKEYTKPFTMDFSRSDVAHDNIPSLRILVIGKTGSWKTKFAQTIAIDGFHGKFGLNLLIIDPNADNLFLNLKQGNPKLLKTLNRFGLSGTSYNSKLISPVTADFPEKVKYGKTKKDVLKYGLSLGELQFFEGAEARRNVLAYLLNISENQGALRILRGIPLNDVKEIPKTVNELLTLAKKGELDRSKGTKGAGGSTLLSFEIEMAIKNKIITDEANVSMPQLLKDHRVVVNTIPLSSSHNPIQSGITACAINSVIGDKLRARKFGKKPINKKKTLIMVDELSEVIKKVASRTNPAGEAIYRFQTKARKVGGSLLCITQKLDDVPSQLMGNWDYIFSSRVTDPDVISRLKLFGPKGMVERILPELSEGYPKEWVCLHDGRLIRFYPFPPQVLMVEESTYL